MVGFPFTNCINLPPAFLQELFNTVLSNSFVAVLLLLIKEVRRVKGFVKSNL